MDSVDFSVNDGQPVHLHIGGGNCVDLNIGGEIYSVVTPPYEGEYLVTPNENTQTLETRDKRLTQNVIVEPIPSNYGLITWDGSVLTVS